MRDTQFRKLRRDVLERLGGLAGRRDHLEVVRRARTILQHGRHRIGVGRAGVDLDREDLDVVRRTFHVVAQDLLTIVDGRLVRTPAILSVQTVGHEHHEVIIGIAGVLCRRRQRCGLGQR